MPEPGLARAMLFGLCPECGSGGLFAGIFRFAPRCPVCGLDFSQFNVGDGPAAFLTMVIGALVVILTLWVQFALDPPLWVYLLLCTPVIFGATIGGLRLCKAGLLASEYQRHAGEAGGDDLRRDPCPPSSWADGD